MQSAEEVAKVAITVRIEGGKVQGLIDKDFGDNYNHFMVFFEHKVVSAWHVLKSNQEEINVVTPDGNRYFFTIEDVKRIGSRSCSFKFRSKACTM